MHFADLPHETRMKIRDIIERAGGETSGYYDEAIGADLPNPFHPFLEAMESAGLKMVPGSMYWFPNCNGAREPMLHDGSYPGSKGFTLSAKFIPTIL